MASDRIVIRGAREHNLKKSSLEKLFFDLGCQGYSRMADRGYVMETGRVVLAGAGRDLLHDDHVRRAYFGG